MGHLGVHLAFPRPRTTWVKPVSSQMGPGEQSNFAGEIFYHFRWVRASMLAWLLRMVLGSGHGGDDVPTSGVAQVCPR